MPLVVPGVARPFLSAGRKPLVKAAASPINSKRDLPIISANRGKDCRFSGGLCPEAGLSGKTRFTPIDNRIALARIRSIA
jgi:hypothetical protein